MKMGLFGTLYFFELRKVLKRRMTWIAFGGVVSVMLLLCFEVLMNNYSITNPQTGESLRYSKYESAMDRQERAEKWNGRLLDDTLLQEMQAAYADWHPVEQETVRDNAVTVSSIVLTEVSDDEAEAERQDQQRRAYEAIYKYVKGVVGEQDVHRVDAAAFYEHRQRMVTEYEDTLHLTEGEKGYWREHEAQVPLIFCWDMGPSMMLAAFKTILALTALMTGMVFSGVFAEEHMRKTDQLVLCSRHGRGRLYLAKLLTVMTLGVVGTLLVEGVALLSFGVLYGYGNNWNGMLQMYLESSPFALTLGEGIVILTVLLLLAAVLHSVLALVF